MNYFAIFQILSFLVMVTFFNSKVGIFDSEKSFLILNFNNFFYFITLSTAPIVLNSIKFFCLTRYLKLKLPFKLCALPVCASIPLNIILPAKGGDFIKFFWIRNNTDFSKKKTTLICIFERLFDLSTIIIIILATILLSFIQSKIIYIYILILFSIYLILIIYRKNRFLFLKLAFVFNVLRWTINLSVLSFLISSIHTDKSISLIDTFFHTSVSIIIGILPISFWGFGTRESYLMTIFPDSLSLNKLFSVGIEYITLFYWIPALILTPFSIYFFTKRRG